jgi:hypothetical protein
MMKRFVLALLCLLPAVARADVDEAVAAVNTAQHAIEGDASCKSLATKLKLSVEALERVRKAPVRANVQQAKGRLETAKEFVATACSDAVRAQVTERIEAAISAIAKVGEPEKKEKTGAAFGAACRANDACASEHCYVGASGDGYCTKTCAAATDCPAHFTCRRVGSAPEKICIR